jgi:hypothetical protein
VSLVEAGAVDGPDLGRAAGAVMTRLTRRTVEVGEPLHLAGDSLESIVWALDRDLAAVRLPGDHERSLRATAAWTCSCSRAGERRPPARSPAASCSPRSCRPAGRTRG